MNYRACKNQITYEGYLHFLRIDRSLVYTKVLTNGTHEYNTYWLR